MLHILDTLEKVKLFMINKHSNFVVINKINNHTLEVTVKLKEEKTNSKRYYVFIKSNYIGTIIEEDIISDGKEIHNKFFIVKANLFNIDDVLYNKAMVFKKLFDFIFKENKIPNNVNIAHIGQCAICGKKLTKPEWIEKGIGKKCFENLNK